MVTAVHTPIEQAFAEAEAELTRLMQATRETLDALDAASNHLAFLRANPDYVSQLILFQEAADNAVQAVNDLQAALTGNYLAANFQQVMQAVLDLIATRLQNLRPQA